MRPRVFPAEDAPLYRVVTSGCFNEAAGIPRGRLRHFRRPSAGSDASMRPRVFPAEDLGYAARSMPTVANASMRPRVFPAEDAAHSWSCERVRAHLRFNEAAGIPRGRRKVGRRWSSTAREVRWRFNEAAGIPRGRLTIPYVRSRLSMKADGARSLCGRTRFNEAAGIPRGRLADTLTASMRVGRGFNEAAGIPRGRPDLPRRSRTRLHKLQ